MANRAGRENGRFSGGRANCEAVPRLSACLVRLALDDPRGVPYLFAWRSWPDDGICERAWISRHEGEDAVYAKIRRPDCMAMLLGTAWPSLPGAGRALLLVCSACEHPRRHLYAWMLWSGRVVRCQWRCRRCAGLRYASEGTYNAVRRLLGGFPRPDTWDPEVSVGGRRLRLP